MAEPETTEEEAPKRRGKGPLLVAFVLALACAGGGFVTAYSGLIPGLDRVARPHDATAATHLPAGSAAFTDLDFVAIEPLVISLDNGGGAHLRFRAQLEVRAAARAEVEHLLPRVVDVLNGYLRAVDIAELRSNAALVRLRAQMLRRVQIVTGGDRVSDLLIMEFVLN